MKRILFPFERIVDADTNKKAIKWEGVDPLEMATRIAALALQKAPPEADTPTLGDSYSLPSLSVDTKFLASDTPDLPQAIIREMENLTVEVYDNTEERYAKKKKSNESKSKELLRRNPRNKPKVESKPSNIRSRTRAGKKRERLTSKSNDSRSTGINSSKSKNKIDPSWDLSFMSQHNPDQFASRYASQQFLRLDRELKALEHFEDCIPSYERVQSNLLESSKAISKSDDSRHEKSKRFYDLYSSVIQQLLALIDMVKETDKENRSRKGFSTATSAKAPKKLAKKKKNAVKVEPSATTTTAKPVVFTKEGFTEYMNQWLKDNWVNPYPDEEVLNEIAIANGTSSSIVNNWLINARTRKWRPAISKAYKNGGTSDALLKESIGIFEEARKAASGKANLMTEK